MNMQDEWEVLYDCLYPAVGNTKEKGPLDLYIESEIPD